MLNLTLELVEEIELHLLLLFLDDLFLLGRSGGSSSSGGRSSSTSSGTSTESLELLTSFGDNFVDGLA
jgi:hypothetical protein